MGITRTSDGLSKFKSAVTSLSTDECSACPFMTKTSENFVPTKKLVPQSTAWHSYHAKHSNTKYEHEMCCSKIHASADRHIMPSIKTQTVQQLPTGFFQNSSWYRNGRRSDDIKIHKQSQAAFAKFKTQEQRVNTQITQRYTT